MNDKAYLIAEACNNFDADYDGACELMDFAREADWDCIKYQMRLRPDRLSPDQHYRLYERASSLGLDYLCSVFDTEGVDILKQFPVDLWKIPSGELTNHSLIQQVIPHATRVFLSTGMSSWEEVRRAGSLFPAEADLVLMQCTSIYPTPYNRVNLSVLSLYVHFHNQVGLSDHTPTIWTLLAAYPLGARFFEKHITTDRTRKGPDHAASLEVGDMLEARVALDAIAEAMGDEKKVIYPEEAEKALQHKHKGER